MLSVNNDLIPLTPQQVAHSFTVYSITCDEPCLIFRSLFRLRSCQFVVIDDQDYQAHFTDPDTLVSWDCVQQVVSDPIRKDADAQRVCLLLLLDLFYCSCSSLFFPRGYSASTATRCRPAPSACTLRWQLASLAVATSTAGPACCTTCP